MWPVKRFRVGWIVPVLCCSLSFSTLAQDPGCTLVLTGNVFDEHDRTPLSYAEVFLPGSGKGGITDEHGNYRVTGICPGTHVVRVTHLGCEPVERRITMDRDMVANFKLEHHHEELRELEVIRKRPDENVGLAQGELDKDAMEKAAGRDLATVISTLPGVNMLTSGPTIGKPVIHGHSGNRVLILNQGVRQEDQQWGNDHAPNLDPFSSDRVTVVKGAASVQYGADAIGGVIITEPVELPRTAGMGGEVRTAGMWNGRGGGTHGMLQGGVRSVPGLGWRLQGSGRQLGDSEAPGHVLSNTGLREAGASVAVGLHRHWGGGSVYYSMFAREMGVLRAAHIGNLTDLQNAISSGVPWYQAPFGYDILPPRQAVMHHLLKAEGRYRLSERDMLVLTYAYQTDDRQEYDSRRAGRSERPALDLFLLTHTADAVVNHWLGPHVHGKVGVSGIHQANYNMPGTGIRPLIPNYAKQSGGVFVLEHFPVREGLELEAGARLEGTGLRVGRFNLANEYIVSEHDFLNHALSVGGNWSPRDSLALRLNISSAFRPPHVSELYSEGLHHGAAAIERGDPRLSSERSLKAAFDIDAHAFNSRLHTQVTLYHDRVSGYIYLRPAGFELTIRGAFPVFDHVATDVVLHGMDLSLEYRLVRDLAWRTRGSIVRGRDITRGEWLFQMPADRMENALLWRRPTLGTWRGVEAAITSTVVARQSRVPPGLDFMDPPEAYHLLGASLSAAKALGRNELRMGVQGNNLLNTSYRDYLDRFRYFADARGLDLTVWLRYGFGAHR